MRLSDLLRCDVHDAAGRPLGRVCDVRLVMDGPLRDGVALPRLDALVVGGNNLAVRLGYLRNGVRGPWPIRWLARRAEARVVEIRPGDVASWELEQRRLVLAPSATPRPLAA